MNLQQLQDNIKEMLDDDEKLTLETDIVFFFGNADSGNQLLAHAMGSIQKDRGDEPEEDGDQCIYIELKPNVRDMLRSLLRDEAQISEELLAEAEENGTH